MIQKIEIEVVNSPTILTRIIQIIKRRRVNIHQFFAEENTDHAADGIIKVVIEADAEITRLLKTQFEKQVDVIAVK